MRTPSRVFTIPPTAPFLPTLARGILDGKLVPGFAPRGKPELLAAAMIYLPTRRAARALSEIFLEETNSSALLLPRIVPLGDVDEDTLAFEAGDLEPLPPVIGPGERRIALAKLISGFAKIEEHLLPASPAIAIALADELAHLMDDFITAGLPFSAIEEAVEGELDRYWERSRDFLKIVGDAWEAHLKERGRIDSAERRDKLLEREARRLENYRGGPVIAAGSTGTLPKVAELLRVIAHHEHGAVVLPGLDQNLNREAFAAIDADKDSKPGHPQFGLKRLIEKIGIAREAVEVLGSPAFPAREEILSLAFRPPLMSDLRLEPAKKAALEGISVVEAADAREEALTIAISLREALHQKKTAALITPDRALARRVCAELSRWSIAIDDSAGLPLAESEAGRFARLLGEAATADAMPSTFLALLRHPYLAWRFSADDIALIEIAVLRGPRPAGGAKHLARSLESAQREKFHRNDIRSRFLPEDWARAKETAQTLETLLTPLIKESDGERNFADLAQAHRVALSGALSEDAPEDCDAMLEALDGLCETGHAAPQMRLSDYIDAFPALIREHTLRPPRDEEARIRILGPLEARMISADRILLGGLCEGVWPPEAHTDSWLNRPMRTALKLDLPERRIGLSAHDFVQAAAAPEVFLVRSRKQSGVETIASRFLQRLEAVADENAWKQALEGGNRYLQLAHALELTEPLPPLKAPKPKPPVSKRPRRFNVSDVRDLVRDPYSIFAKHILVLNPLEPVDAEPGVRERGTLLHDILSNFSNKFPENLPHNALEELIAIGRKAFASLQDFPAAHAVWWPRFTRVAKWFVREEAARRASIERVLSETSGRLEFTIGGTSYLLNARADRIDIVTGDTISILDYKSGELPTLSQCLAGFEPQLPLEAAIARGGGFKGINAGISIGGLGPVRISGGIPPGEYLLFNFSKSQIEKSGIASFDQLADRSIERFKGLLESYAKEDQAYHSTPRAKWRKRYNHYDHLARLKEWSVAEGEGDSE
jgi:ATP-dependent helicase/nuclease subunit B